MKVLVASELGQGTRPSDVMDAIEGELVYMVDVCPDSRRFPYSAWCDCGITFCGIVSGEVTSTALVRDLEGLSYEGYVACLEATHGDAVDGGCSCGFDAEEIATALVAIAAPLRDGTVVERCVDRVRVRLRAA